MFKYILATFVLNILLVLNSSFLFSQETVQKNPVSIWPTWRGDAERTGYTPEILPTKLSLSWVLKNMHPPARAWPGEERLSFDIAFCIIANKDLVFFGSSADGKLYAIEAETGLQRWDFYTEAPIRFAPVLVGDKVLVASDDGYLYCLSTNDGKLLWKIRGGPNDQKILGNGQMISRWPARGGPVVYENTVYFAAGIWPAEGVYIHAINLEDGKIIWTNDSTGSMERSHPHDGRVIASGIGAQGYMLATDNLLLIPTGRGLPVVLNRADGKFKHFRVLQKIGGATTILAKPYFFNGDSLFNLNDGLELNKDPLIQTQALAISPTMIAGSMHGKKELLIIDRINPLLKKEVEGKIQINLNIISKIPSFIPTVMAISGNSLIVGGIGQLVTIDLKTLSSQSIGTIEGVPSDLAIANGRLFVSTNKGTIYCFDGNNNKSPKINESVAKLNSATEASIYTKAADEIINKSKITEGYCLDLACGNGDLAIELAKKTKLKIIAIEGDLKLVEEARKNLDNLGLYGDRVFVLHGDPSLTTFSRYFANLIVSGRSVTEGPTIINMKSAQYSQRPFDGVICLGKSGEISADVRGPLVGAGNWTHLYGNPGNTGSSEDSLAKTPLRILWFGGPDLDTPNRHGRPPSPLFWEGRLIVQGIDAIRAVDAYNGRLLWEFPLKGVGKPYQGETLMGVSGDGGNICLSAEGVFVRIDGKCIQIDIITGKELNTFELPQSKGKWGYLACESGRLYGTITNDEHLVRSVYKLAPSMLRTESMTLFAIDIKTKKYLWTYNAKNSIRNNTIAVGGGRVFFIDRPTAKFDLPTSAEKKGTQEIGRLVSIDASSGNEVWSNSENIFGTILAYSDKYKVLLMAYQSSRYSLNSEVGGKISTFNASDGKKLWEELMSYTRPLIVDRIVYGLPNKNSASGTLDLLTGKPTPLSSQGLAKSGHGCTVPIASQKLLLFRSGTLGYLDLSNGALHHYGGIRSGCWISAIPVGGLVILPDSTNGCSCSYQNKTSIALDSPD